MIELTDEQNAAVDKIIGNRICLLTGGPGTGKTTTLSVAAKEMNPHETYFCAPTGRAAQRMSEALGESGLGMTATTIHSLLMPTRNGHEKKGWGFGFNKQNKLPAKNIVCDETSMCDNSILQSLITALSDDCRLILVGDPDQLPPVGVGAGLRDLISTGIVPHAKLTKIHRFAGRIAHACRQINLGKRWIPSAAINDSPDAGEFGPENLKHIERRSPAECIDAMQSTIEALIDRRGFHPLNDIQVLCSRNDQGPMSRKVLNERLQVMLNKDGETLEGCPFRVGDKIMCLQNGFRESFDQEGLDKLGQVYIANGEIGNVVSIDKKDVLIKFAGLFVKFPRGVWFTQLTLAYAITVHKSQGGGWPVCIYMIDEARHVDRSLVYTALSRGKKFDFTIGKLQVLHQQCERMLLEQRKTFLSEKICEGMVV